MAPTDIVGNYAFHLQGTVYANTLREGGKEGSGFEQVRDFVAGEVLPSESRETVKNLERPAMTAFLSSQYPPVGNKQKWPPDPPPLPPGPSNFVFPLPFPSPGIVVPIFTGPPFDQLNFPYHPNVGFYPYAEIGEFQFLAGGTVNALIRWNIGGIPGRDFIFFEGAYQLSIPKPPKPTPKNKHPPVFKGMTGKISLQSVGAPFNLTWDYAFAFTSNTREEAMLMAAARMPRPLNGSGRMILL